MEKVERDEMVGVLIAISVVSKRLAGRISELMCLTQDKEEKVERK